MCGFIGELRNKNVLSNNTDQWNKQLEAIHHRGPDDTGNYFNKDVRFGFKRLSIIDLENGDQPLSYEDERYQIIFNGEIYNYLELKQDLIEQGYSFETNSDTEVILALYACKKEACVQELRGMFAFVIWDKQEEQIFAARDHFGIKPFYYQETEEKFAFASEQKSIATHFNPEDISNQSLQHYLTYQFVPEPFCLSKQIRKLQPGHYLIKAPNQEVSIHRYFKVAFHPGTQSFTDYKKRTREVLDDSVNKHMRSDVPVGAFLSSGIDSTSIVALAKQYNPNIKTFTVGFEREGFSEIDIAKDTAEKLNVENIHKVITPKEFIEELPNIIWHMDDPVADPAAVPLYFVAKEASKHVKVVLSGEGADELFGGYNIYREPLALNWFNRIPAPFKRILNKFASYMPEGMKGKSYLLRGTTPLAERYIGNAKIFSEKEKERLLVNYDKGNPYTHITRHLYKEAEGYDDSLKMQYIDIHTWLRGDILVKADRMTMAHSLELRVPFLDKEVFKVASEVPTSAKIANGTTKYVLRQAMKEIIPETILDRKKLGFPVPIRHWLKNELYDWAKDLINNSPTEDLFNKHVALDLLEEHASDKQDNSRKLWVVLCFMLWHSMHVESVENNMQTAYENVDAFKQEKQAAPQASS